MIRRLLLAALLVGAAPAQADTLLLKPARVFDGVNAQPHEGWSVLVEGDRIAAAGPAVAAPADARVIELPGATLMPGMIEGHSHLFLHPYNEKLWDDQVLHEPLALRTARAVVQAAKTLDAGFTPNATSAPKARAPPTRASARRSTRASSPALASSLRPRPSLPAAHTGRRAMSRESRSRRAPRKSAASRKLCARFATRSQGAQMS